ncbi:hypothetical protein [Brasilonema bromeliae]|uniref:Uncharacterized protein n=1 Tax=Brasilonema bromeliae SPC951 TaxID=385972 RepID=A0ABX1P7N4_9CYAN|nr:hypothetical protein [Brasilonema bromeliae]NMG20314.1 hypothetical protein [Brasilonema bromeliae SPC951]
MYMNNFRRFIVLMGLALTLLVGSFTAPAFAQETLAQKDAPTTAPIPVTQPVFDPPPPPDPTDKNECWSGRNCEGRILNNRDAHNCKNSGGKSWRSRLTGDCTNL